MGPGAIARFAAPLGAIGSGEPREHGEAGSASKRAWEEDVVLEMDVLVQGSLQRE